MIVRTVGWDNGFGDEKFMVEKTVATDKPGGVKKVYETFSFPSTFYEISNDSVLRSWTFMEELSLNQLIIEYEGVTYGIGNYAIMQDAMGGSRNYSADKFREKTELIKLLAALAYAYPDESQIVVEKLMCGLSLESYKYHKADLEQHFSNRTFNFKVPSKGVMKPVTVEIKIAKCIPQGLGAFYDRYLDFGPDGRIMVSQKNSALKDMRYGLVDIGEKTIDAFVAQGRDPIDRSEVVLKRGISDAFALAGKKLGNAPVNLVQQAYIQHKESLFWAGKRYYNIAELCEEAFEEIAKDIGQKLLANWKNHMERIEMVLLCGGGANAIDKYIKEMLPYVEVVVMDEPQFSNVRGYYKLGALEDSVKRPDEPAKKTEPIVHAKAEPAVHAKAEPVAKHAEPAKAAEEKKPEKPAISEVKA